MLSVERGAFSGPAQKALDLTPRHDRQHVHVRSGTLEPVDHRHHEAADSDRKELQGSGMCSGGIAEMFRREVRQQSPVLGFRCTVLPQPAPLGLGQRVVAQSVLVRQPGPV